MNEAPTKLLTIIHLKLNCRRRSLVIHDHTSSWYLSPSRVDSSIFTPSHMHKRGMNQWYRSCIWLFTSVVTRCCYIQYQSCMTGERMFCPFNNNEEKAYHSQFCLFMTTNSVKRYTHDVSVKLTWMMTATCFRELELHLTQFNWFFCQGIYWLSLGHYISLTETL